MGKTANQKLTQKAQVKRQAVYFTMMFYISCQESGYRNLEGKCFEKDLQLAGLEERASILTRNFLK